MVQYNSLIITVNFCGTRTRLLLAKTFHFGPLVGLCLRSRLWFQCIILKYSSDDILAVAFGNSGVDERHVCGLSRRSLVGLQKFSFALVLATEPLYEYCNHKQILLCFNWLCCDKEPKEKNYHCPSG